MKIIQYTHFESKVLSTTFFVENLQNFKIYFKNNNKSWGVVLGWGSTGGPRDVEAYVQRRIGERGQREHDYQHNRRRRHEDDLRRNVRRRIEGRALRAAEMRRRLIDEDDLRRNVRRRIEGRASREEGMRRRLMVAY